MWGPVCVCIRLCIVAFVCFAFVFNYLRLYMHLLECCRGNPQDYPPPHPFHPRGLSDIWLWMDTSYPQVIRAVKPLGAAAVHIITTLLGLCLEVR